MDRTEIFRAVLIVLAMLLLLAAPFALEYHTFRRDKKNKISHRRFRVLVFAAVYIAAVTVALCVLRDQLREIASLPAVQWVLTNFAPPARLAYAAKAFSAVLVNSAVGFLFWLLRKIVRIGLKSGSITAPRKGNVAPATPRMNPGPALLQQHTRCLACPSVIAPF